MEKKNHNMEAKFLVNLRHQLPDMKCFCSLSKKSLFWRHRKMWIVTRVTALEVTLKLPMPMQQVILKALQVMKQSNILRNVYVALYNELVYNSS